MTGRQIERPKDIQTDKKQTNRQRVNKVKETVNEKDRQMNRRTDSHTIKEIETLSGRQIELIHKTSRQKHTS
jgi:hypothetical protein